MSSFLGGGGGGSSGLTVGVTTITGGSNNFLLYDNAGILGERLDPYTPATSNLDFYVATTGSDSNPGTIGSPFATIQHAVNIVSLFDYVATWKATIHVAAGTYTVTTAINLNETVRAGDRMVIVGAGHALTTVKNSSNPGDLWSAAGPNSQWIIRDLGNDCTRNVFSSGTLAGLDLAGTVDVADSTLGGQQIIFTLGGDASAVSTFGATLNIANPFLDFAQSGSAQALLVVTGTGITLPGSAFGSANNNFWFFNQGSGSFLYEFFSNTIVNGSSFQGSRAVLLGTGGGQVLTQNGLVTDLPGVASGTFIDQTVWWFNAISGANTGQGITLTSAPFTSSGLNTDFFLIARDTTNGPRSLVINDAGTVYTRQIGNFINAQSGASYTLALFDQEGVVEMTNAGANTLTVPTNASVAFPKGTQIRVVQAGAGATTIAAAGGVTGHNFGTIAAQWDSVVLYQRAINEWVMTL